MPANPPPRSANSSMNLSQSEAMLKRESQSASSVPATPVATVTHSASRMLRAAVAERRWRS